jgi:hypothetical protein
MDPGEDIRPALIANRHQARPTAAEGESVCAICGKGVNLSRGGSRTYLRHNPRTFSSQWVPDFP